MESGVLLNFLMKEIGSQPPIAVPAMKHRFLPCFADRWFSRVPHRWQAWCPKAATLPNRSLFCFPLVRWKWGGERGTQESNEFTCPRKSSHHPFSTSQLLPLAHTAVATDFWWAAVSRVAKREGLRCHWWGGTKTGAQQSWLQSRWVEGRRRDSVPQCWNQRLRIRWPLEHHKCVLKLPPVRPGCHPSPQAEERASCVAHTHAAPGTWASPLWQSLKYNGCWGCLTTTGSSEDLSHPWCYGQGVEAELPLAGICICNKVGG